MTRKRILRIGTAGWSLPRGVAPPFPDNGSHLQRYAAAFDAVEINSSFYRSHRRETYARWAATVPSSFRFSVKLAREITHDLRLRACAAPLRKFLGEIDGLGPKLGCLLIQLPPSFAFERASVTRFLTLLRRHFDGNAVVEPRHATWFEPIVEDTLRAFDVGRVGSDPALCVDAAYRWRIRPSRIAASTVSPPHVLLQLRRGLPRIRRGRHGRDRIAYARLLVHLRQHRTRPCGHQRAAPRRTDRRATRTLS